MTDVAGPGTPGDAPPTSVTSSTSPSSRHDGGSSQIRRRVLDADGVARVTTRLAHEIAERNDGTEDLVLMGIRTRGVPLAARLAALLERIDGRPVPCGSLDVTLYRDDLSRRGPLPLGQTRFPVPIDGRIVVLVDDVLYTGRTIRAALEALLEVGRPRAVRLAALVDRGHRELPIRADHVGKNLPTALAEQVEVRLSEVDGEDAVDIVAPAPNTDPAPAPAGAETPQ